MGKTGELPRRLHATSMYLREELKVDIEAETVDRHRQNGRLIFINVFEIWQQGGTNLDCREYFYHTYQQQRHSLTAEREGAVRPFF